MKKTVSYLIVFIFFLGISKSISAQSDNIEIKSERLDDNSIQISYTKKKPGSYYLKVTFPRLENSYPTIYQDVIKYSSGNLIRLQPIDPDKQISYSMRYNTIRGVPNPKIDSTFQYVLPFRNYKKMKVVEATNMNESYFGAEKPLDWKSYVVYSKNPDTICSMRKGIVIALTNNYTADQSAGKWFSSERNNILIEHEDGSMAEYKGFKKNSFFVKLGQNVYPQSKLGIIEAFDNDKHRLDFSIYYLYDSSLRKKEKVSIKNYKSRNKYLNPYFVTANGVHKLKSGEIYVSESNPTVLFAEFSKKEKKKHKKNPGLFQ